MGGYYLNTDISTFHDIYKFPFNLNLEVENLSEVKVAKKQDYIFKGTESRFYAYDKNEFGELSPFNVEILTTSVIAA